MIVDEVLPDVHRVATPRLKKHVWYATGSALLAAAMMWLPLGRWLPTGSSGEMRLSFVEYLYLPSVIPAALLARAVHGAADLLLWIAITVQTWAMVSLVASISRRVLRHAHRS